MKNMRLRLARVEADLSQEDLAHAVGVTRQTIGLIEAGGYNPTLNLCVSICKVLKKTLDDLFWGVLLGHGAYQTQVRRMSRGCFCEITARIVAATSSIDPVASTTT